MSNAMVPFSSDNLPSTFVGTPDDAKQATSGGTYLGRIQLFSKGKNFDDGYFMQPGHFGIPNGGSSCEDLGKSIDVMPLAFRFKAIDYSDKPYVITHDKDSEAYKQIVSANDSSCHHGLSFLVIERTTGGLYELFFGNKSSRGEGEKIRAFCPISGQDIARLEAAGHDTSNMSVREASACTIKSNAAKNDKGQWFIPMTTACSTPFENFPSQQEIYDEIVKFLNPRDKVVDTADASVATRAR